MRHHPLSVRSIRRPLACCVAVLALLLALLAGHTVTFAADGVLDPLFAPVLDEIATTVAIQADGKILIGGSFTSVNGVSRSHLARFNPDGSLDPAFVSAINGPVYRLVVQGDGKIVIGGYFTSVNGVSRRGIARLNADGSLDPTFAPSLGANGSVDTVAVQADGKILIEGSFTSVNGVSRGGIARLNADGSLDPGFAPGTISFIETIAVQADGKILIGGHFTSVNGVGRTYIARLNANGSLDPAFAPSLGTNEPIHTIAVQAGGKILIGGSFASVNGVSRGGIARLNADGSVDPTFAPSPGADGSVFTIAVQADGKVLIGGYFTSVNGAGRVDMARLNTDGSVDPTFAPSFGPSDNVRALAIQPDGQIVLAGYGFSVNGEERHSVARLSSSTATPVSGPSIALSPSTAIVGQGQTFEVDIQFNTDYFADTIDAYLSFDPAVLEVVDAAGTPATSITAHPAFVGSVTYNQVNPATGQIDFSASAYEEPYLGVSATVATIRFRAKAPITTAVQLVRSGIRQTDLFGGGSRREATLVPATIQIQAHPVLQGRIALEQRGPAGTASWITPLRPSESLTPTGGITLYQPGTQTEVGRFTAITDTDGRFRAVLTNVPRGTYDIRVKGTSTLSNQRANVDLNTAAEIDFGTLRVGDSTDDDGVTGADVSYLIRSFLLRAGHPYFLPEADTNRDDEITGADVSALIPNFLRSGAIAVGGVAQEEPAGVRAESSTRPQITLNPGMQRVQVGQIVPIQVQAQFGDAAADTVDLHLTLDPTLLEVVDAAGQPARVVTVNRSAFKDVIYNRVDGATGHLHLSASRLTGPAAMGSLTVATFYVRVKQHFTTTALTVTTTGTGPTDVFMRGQSLQPSVGGSLLTTAEVYRTFIPQTSQ